MAISRCWTYNSPTGPTTLDGTARKAAAASRNCGCVWCRVLVSGSGSSSRQPPTVTTMAPHCCPVQRSCNTNISHFGTLSLLSCFVIHRFTKLSIHFLFVMFFSHDCLLRKLFLTTFVARSHSIVDDNGNRNPSLSPFPVELVDVQLLIEVQTLLPPRQSKSGTEVAHRDFHTSWRPWSITLFAHETSQSPLITFPSDTTSPLPIISRKWKCSFLLSLSL